jgi:hypothetical protein
LTTIAICALDRSKIKIACTWRWRSAFERDSASRRDARQS